MQTFDTEIKQTTYYFIRVTYGKGDLWYHVSYEKDDKRFTFRMTKNNSDTWKTFDTQDPLVLDVENLLSNCISDFEAKVPFINDSSSGVNATADRLHTL